MRWNVTGVPAAWRFVGPPPDVTVTLPSTGTPCSDSFQASSSAVALTPAAVCAAPVNVPRFATPVETPL